MYNANNYGYNPYGRYIPQQPMQQPIQQPIEQFNTVQNRNVLNGEIVDSIEVAKTIKYPLDGSTSYYPLASGEAIVSKQLQNDGTSKLTVYKPVVEEEKESPKYATIDDLNKVIKKFDLSDIEDDIKDLKSEIKDLKKKKKDD